MINGKVPFAWLSKWGMGRASNQDRENLSTLPGDLNAGFTSAVGATVTTSTVLLLHVSASA